MPCPFYIVVAAIVTRARTRRKHLGTVNCVRCFALFSGRIVASFAKIEASLNVIDNLSNVVRHITIK